jgi:predicted ATP-dependent serine protease
MTVVVGIPTIKVGDAESTTGTNVLEIETLSSELEAAEKTLLKKLEECENVLSGGSPSDASTAVLPEAKMEIPAEEEAIQEFIFSDDPRVGENRNILAVKIPEEMKNNIPTGHKEIDILMAGDGVTPSTACLVTGVPGAGKSTMMFQLADSITKSGNIALYNTCEESLVQVSRVAKRLKLHHGFNISSHRNIFDIIKHAKVLQEANPNSQVFLFVDSLQTVEVPHVEYDPNTCEVLTDEKTGEPLKRKGRTTSGQTTQVEVTKILTLWCKKTYGVCFLIGQVNKDGDFAGRQAIKHWIDAHLHLDINKEKHSADYGMRTAEMTKNRFGIAGIFFPFELEARGVKWIPSKEKK